MDAPVTLAESGFHQKKEDRKKHCSHDAFRVQRERENPAVCKRQLPGTGQPADQQTGQERKKNKSKQISHGRPYLSDSF